MKKILVLLLLLCFIACNKTTFPNYSKLEGFALGTTFHITYQNIIPVKQTQIDSLLYLVNKSLSTYIPNSDISKINKGDTTVLVDAMFLEVFNKSKQVYKQSNGAFDPTIGALVNAWGFGPENKLNNIKPQQVDSLLHFVGFEKVHIKNAKVDKPMQTYLDFNATAKGYAVDIIGRFLETKKIYNYMVEIGGEIRARGKNQKNNFWKIAIEKPNFDGSTRSIQTVIELNNEAIATSGNYRKFKINTATGEKYAHTINPKTGYPSKSNLLSASVIAALDCADVDAYATAFMAMGFEKSKLFLEKYPHLKAFLIYSDEQGVIKTFASTNLKE